MRTRQGVMRKLSEERGFAVVTAIMVVGIMLALGLSAYAYVGSQTSQSRDERVRETAFNLSESALNSTANFLSTKWPTPANPYPSSCNQASTSASCPSPTGVTGGQTGSQWSWTTEVHDNGAPSASYYSDTTTRTQPRYDANGDGNLWIRASGVRQGRIRTIVGLVNSRPVLTAFPQNVVTAGYFGTTNTGNKVIVDTQGSGSQPSTLAVRCSDSGDRPNSCLNYSPSKGQVSPDTTQVDYQGGDALSSADIDALRKRAQSLGSYYASCPSSLTGTLVFVEGPADCSYSGTSNYNSPSGTGMLVIVNGTLSLGGTGDYYGLVYAANAQNSTGTVVHITGDASIIGAVAVDRGGGVLAGSSKTNLIYDRTVFNNVTVQGAVTLIQNGWREIASH
jgi:Tfp pilus assembly protein PilX